MQVAEGFICDVCRIRDRKQTLATIQIEFSGTGPRGTIFNHQIMELCEFHNREALSTPPEPDEIVHRITKC